MMFVASCSTSAFVTGSTVRFATLMPSAVSVRSFLTESGPFTGCFNTSMVDSSSVILRLEASRARLVCKSSRAELLQLYAGESGAQIGLLHFLSQKKPLHDLKLCYQPPHSPNC